MNESRFRAVEQEADPRIEEIYEKAAEQVKKDPDDATGERKLPLLDGVSPEEAREFIGNSLTRIDSFVATAKKDDANGLRINREAAEKIGSIWIFSGVGTYDSDYKPTDNPRHIKPYMAGTNRQRIDHAVLLASQIAQMRSGRRLTVPMNPSPKEREAYFREAREMMAEFSPDFVFGGFEEENLDAEQVLEREGIIIPKERVSIIRPKNGERMFSTADQVDHFISPEGVRDKEVAFVSNDIHLDRILLILSKTIKEHPDHLPEGKPVHLFPTRTPVDGQQDFSYSEIVQSIRYWRDYHRAAQEPYPYTLEH